MKMCQNLIQKLSSNNFKHLANKESLSPLFILNFSLLIDKYH